MIHVRHVINLIDEKSVGDFELHEYCGQTIRELAPSGAKFCLDSRGVLRTENDDSWDDNPNSDDVLTYATLDGDPTGLTVAITLFILKAAVVAAVGLGLNALFGPRAPSLDSGLDVGGAERSNAYSFGPLTNPKRLGASKPVIYGEHMTAPTIVEFFRTAGADETESFLNVILQISEGPIEQIGIGDNEFTTDQDGLTDNLPTGFKFDGIEADEFEDIEMDLRFGSIDQTAMPLFNNEIIREYPHQFGLDNKVKKGKKEKPDKDFIFNWKTREPVDGVMVQYGFPNGLFRQGSEGKDKLAPFLYQMDIYEEDGTTLITTSEEQRDEFRRRGEMFRSFRIDGIASLTTAVSPTGGRRKVVVEFYRRNHTYYLDKSSTVQDKAVLTAIQEIVSAEVSYAGVSCIGVRLKASKKLAGGVPQMLVRVKGRKVVRTISGVPQAEAYSTNPAWIMRDALTNERYGLGSDLRQSEITIDATSFEAYAAFCDELIDKFTGSPDQEKRFEIAIVADSRRSGWEFILAIGSVSRAVPMKIGTTIFIALENVAIVTQRITHSMIRQDTLQIDSINRRNAPNYIEVGFLDAEDDYQLTSQSSHEPDIAESSPGLRRRVVQQFGTTRKTQAKRQASYALRAETYPKWRYRFDMGIEAIAFIPGDVVFLQIPVPDWNISGRLEVPDGGNIVLDEEFVFESDVTYIYYERDNEDDTWLNNTFVAPEGVTNKLAFAPLHGDTGPNPAQGRNYLLGRRFVAEHTMRIMEIRSSGDPFIRTIEAIQYVPAAFSDASEAIADSVFDPTPGTPPTVVTNITFVETSTQNGVSNIAVSWTPTAGGYRIYYRVRTTAEQAYILVGETTSSTFTIIAALDFATDIEVKIVTVSADGQVTDFDTSPTAIYQTIRLDNSTVLAVFPGDITNLALVTVSGNEKKLTWDALPATYNVVLPRIGTWDGSPYLGNVSKDDALPNEFPLNVLNIPTTYYVRAMRWDPTDPVDQTIRDEGMVSAVVAQVDSPATQFGSFSNLHISDDVDFSQSVVGFVAIRENNIIELATESKITNGIITDWTNSPNGALLQDDKEQALIFETKIYDLGSSAATHVNVYPVVHSHIDLSPEQLGIFGDVPNWTPFGRNEQGAMFATNSYVGFTAIVSYSIDGVNFLTYPIQQHLNESVVLTAQYFQIILTAVSNPVVFVVGGPPGDQDGVTSRVAKALLEKLETRLFRVP